MAFRVIFRANSAGVVAQVRPLEGANFRRAFFRHTEIAVLSFGTHETFYLSHTSALAGPPKVVATASSMVKPAATSG